MTSSPTAGDSYSNSEPTQSYYSYYVVGLSDFRVSSSSFKFYHYRDYSVTVSASGLPPPPLLVVAQ